MSNNKNGFCFGDLRVGEHFVFHNSYINKTPARDYLLKKISARKYKVIEGAAQGKEFSTSVKVGVALA